MDFTVWKSRAEVSPHSFGYILDNFTEIPIKISGKLTFQLFKTKKNRNHPLSKQNVKLTFLIPFLTHNNKNNRTKLTHIDVVSFLLTLKSV